MYRHLITLALLAVASSCIKFNGNLDVKERFTLYHQQNGKLYRRVLPADQYPASLKMINKKSVELYFKLRDGRNIKTHMRIPNANSIPQNDGNFLIPSTQTAQNYDIRGTVATKTTKDPTTYYGTDVCRDHVFKYVCDTVCGNNGCQNVCGHKWVYAQGYQNVEFKKIYLDRVLTMNFVLPQTRSRHATFTGNNQEVQRDYIYKGRCIIN